MRQQISGRGAFMWSRITASNAVNFCVIHEATIGDAANGIAKASDATSPDTGRWFSMSHPGLIMLSSGEEDVRLYELLFLGKSIMQ